MIQNKGDGCRIKARIDRIENAARHRHAVMGVVDRWDVGREHGHRIVLADTLRGELARKPSCPVVRLTIRIANIAMHDGLMIRIHGRTPPQKRQRAERHVIRRVLVQILFVFICHAGHSHSPAYLGE